MSSLFPKALVSRFTLCSGAVDLLFFLSKSPSEEVNLAVELGLGQSYSKSHTLNLTFLVAEPYSMTDVEDTHLDLCHQAKSSSVIGKSKSTSLIYYSNIAHFFSGKKRPAHRASYKTKQRLKHGPVDPRLLAKHLKRAQSHPSELVAHDAPKSAGAYLGKNSPPPAFSTKPTLVPWVEGYEFHPHLFLA